MFVTASEAAEIYAKASLKWYGPRAHSVAHSMVRKLNKKGDAKGVRAWQEVSHQLAKLENPARSAKATKAPTGRD